jgi:hypothetical protein
MASVHEPSPAPIDRPHRRIPTTATRAGYLVSAALNGVLLWAAHRLLDWGWPAFLTDDFELVLGIVTASFIASVVVNLALAVHHRGRIRALADTVTAGFGLAVGVRMWAVFPFDFQGYETDWSGWVRVAIVVGIAATGVAIIANLAKLVAGSQAVT